MKYRMLTLLIVIGLLSPHIVLAHGTSVRGGMGMMGYDMVGYDMMMNDAGCPMMTGMAMSADYLLSYKDELELSKMQVSKLKNIRDDYQNEAVSLYADLNRTMLELHNLLGEDELNIVKIRATNKKIEEIESELRTNNIETYVSAKLLLTREQLKKVRDMGIFEMQQMHGYQGMMR